MIAHKKEFYSGVGLMIAFMIVLVLFFLPLYNGENGMSYFDNLYNSISKDSAYYIPSVQEEAKEMVGTNIDVQLKYDNERQAKAAVSLLTAAGATAKPSGAALSVQGDLGRILDSALTDAEAMYRNDGDKVEQRYSIEPRTATYLWWLSLKSMDQTLKTQSKFQEALMVDLVKTRGVEMAYNYYGVAPESIMDRAGMVIFSLVFYVVYTLWYGFAILFMFEGWGLRLSH